MEKNRTMKRNTSLASSVAQLLVCLALSLITALTLIGGAIYFDFRETLNLALPVIPILFPLFYQFLDISAGRDKATDGRPSFWRRQFSLRFSEMRSLRVVLIGVLLGLGIKFVMEGLFLYTYYRKSGLPFDTLFGGRADDLLGRFLRGELLALTGPQVLPLLVVEALVLTAIGGLWIGLSSPGSGVLEALFAGTILAFFATLTNLSLLYTQVESVTRTAASLFGAGSFQTFSLTGPLLQVFLFGWWTIVGHRWRRRRSARTHRSR
jgi:hypothetical protein